MAIRCGYYADCFNHTGAGGQMRTALKEIKIDAGTIMGDGDGEWAYDFWLDGTYISSTFMYKSKPGAIRAARRWCGKHLKGTFNLVALKREK